MAPPGQSTPATLRPQETAHGKPRLAVKAPSPTLKRSLLVACLAWCAPIGHARRTPPALRRGALIRRRGRAGAALAGSAAVWEASRWGCAAQGRARWAVLLSATAGRGIMKSTWALALVCALLLAGKCFSPSGSVG